VADFLSILRRELKEVLSAKGGLARSAIDAAVDQLIQRVRWRFGGDRIRVPKIDRAKRDREILRAWRAGTSPAGIAQSQRVPASTVYEVINRHRPQRKRPNNEGFGSGWWNL